MLCFAATLGVSLLLGLYNLSAANKDNCDLYAAVGQSLTLPAVYKGLGKSHLLRWTHNSTIVFYMQGGKVSVGKPEDVSSAGSLMLKNLQLKSAGIYQINVLYPNGTLAMAWTGRLCMMDRVSKPHLDYVCNFNLNAVNLNCRVDKPQGLVFSWMLDKKALPSETQQTLSISLKQLEGERSFSCGVANKVSKESSDTVRPICKAPVDLCFTGKTVLGAVVGGAAVIFLLLLTIIVLCCRLKRSKNQMNLSHPEEQRMHRLAKHDSTCPEYETMHPGPDSTPPSFQPSPTVSPQDATEPEAQGQDKPPQLSTAAEGQSPLPVPKPRMPRQ